MNQLHVVGAGWSGLSAAIHGVLSGFSVTVHETSRQAGGRAQSVSFKGLDLDNGQHILTGACTETLKLLKRVGVDEQSAFMRMPLRLSTPHHSHARWLGKPHAFARLWGLLSDPQMSLSERLEWLSSLLALKLARPADWRNHSVGSWLDGHAGHRVRPWLEALCVSALNLDAHEANASVFLQVMQESFKTPQASDLLLPCVGLSELLPGAALTWLRAKGAVIQLGHRVDDLQPLLQTGDVILACSPKEAARLSACHAPDWSSKTKALSTTAIATVYTQWTDEPPVLPDPLIFLPFEVANPAQVVIDLGVLRPSVHSKGFWSWVASDSQLDREATMARVLDQAQQIWGRCPEVKACFLDPRATLACRPSIERPGAMISKNLWACGDYIESFLPSTLEGSVRSGQQVIEKILAHRHGSAMPIYSRAHSS